MVLTAAAVVCLRENLFLSQILNQQRAGVPWQRSVFFLPPLPVVPTSPQLNITAWRESSLDSQSRVLFAELVVSLDDILQSLQSRTVWRFCCWFDWVPAANEREGAAAGRQTSPFLQTLSLTKLELGFYTDFPLKFTCRGLTPQADGFPRSSGLLR